METNKRNKSIEALRKGILDDKPVIMGKIISFDPLKQPSAIQVMTKGLKEIYKDDNL